MRLADVDLKFLCELLLLLQRMHVKMTVAAITAPPALGSTTHTTIGHSVIKSDERPTKSALYGLCVLTGTALYRIRHRDGRRSRVQCGNSDVKPSSRAARLKTALFN